MHEKQRRLVSDHELELTSSTTMSIFGEPAFPHFGKLPTEIQMQIWRYAATPYGMVLYPEDSYFLEMSWQLSNSTIRYHLFSLYTRMYIQDYRPGNPEYYVAVARLGLMSTCRCARQIALEAWRKDIETIVVGVKLKKWERYAFYGDDLVERKYEVKWRLIANLSSIIT